MSQNPSCPFSLGTYLAFVLLQRSKAGMADSLLGLCKATEGVAAAGLNCH